jgi:Fuc2NAc and GlcNAc transferase
VTLFLVIAAFLLGWLGTLAIEHFAPRMGLVQAPNARSSHTRPTPRGGGLAIAVAVVLAATVLGLWPIAALTAIIAALGFADDLRDLSPALRFPIQTLVFIALLWTTGPLPPIPLPFGLALSGLVLPAILLLIGLWWLNLFNFMDGIDGIAGSQAVLLLAGSTLIWWSAEPAAWQSPILALALAGAAATAGFLLRNWPPARIFMGDAGSNALALLIFAIALATIASGQFAYQPWLVLPSVFVTDATVTLLRRIARGERPWHAHRRHAYQQLSRLWGHRRVTLLYGALTALWAFPLAFAAQHLPDWSWWLALLVYVPLIILAITADAGGASETKS